jgi:hypothetical protein
MILRNCELGRVAEARILKSSAAKYQQILLVAGDRTRSQNECHLLEDD